MFSFDLLLRPPGYPRHTHISDELECVWKHWQSSFKCVFGLVFLPLELLVLAVLRLLVTPSKDNVRPKIHPQIRAAGSRGHRSHHNQLMAKFLGSAGIRGALDVCGSLSASRSAGSMVGQRVPESWS